MHILTATVLAGLFRLGSRPRRSPLLTSLGPIRTAHLLPGRARFLVQRLRGDEDLCRQLADRLVRLDGVRTARISAVSGSIVVTFDVATVEPALLVAALVKLLGLEKEIERPPRAVLGSELRELGAAVNRAVLEESGGLVDATTALSLGLALIGIARLTRADVARWPAAATMLWWAYGALARRDGGSS